MNPFDPYYTWLGIPPEEQPPHRYRLLGIQPFEASREVIQNAADQRMTYLRTLGMGSQGDVAQRLLNEVAAARVMLLDTDKKARYDKNLQQSLARRQPPPVPIAREPSHRTPSASGTSAPPASEVSEPFVFEQSPSLAEASVSRRRPSVKSASGGSTWLWSVGGVAVVVLAIAWITWNSSSRSREIEPSQEIGAGHPTPTDKAPDDSSRLALIWPLQDRAQAQLDLDGRSPDLSGQGVRVSSTHFEIPVSPGRHRIRVTWSNGDRFDREFVVSQGSTTRVTVDRLPALAQGKPGLLASYFRDEKFTDLDFARVDPNIHFLWDHDPPADSIPQDHFSIRWEGFLKAPRPGRYVLAADADDVLAVWIDGEKILDVNCDQQSAEVELSDQPHAIRVEHSDFNHSAYAALCWSLPGIHAQQAIPPEALFADRSLAERSKVPESVMRPVSSAAILDANVASHPIDLLAAIEPNRDTKVGMWWFDQGTLLCSRRFQQPHGDDKACQLRLPMTSLKSNYRITAIVERCVGADLFRMCLVTPQGEAHVVFDGHPLQGYKSAIWGVPRETQVVGQRLKSGQLHTIECEVRHDGIEVLLDGQDCMRWQGHWRDMPDRPVRKDIQIDCYDTIFRIHALTWEPLAPVAVPDLAGPNEPGMVAEVPPEVEPVKNPEAQVKAVKRPAPRHVLKYEPDDAWIRFSPDGRYLACNSARGIELWDPRSERIVRTFRHASPGREVTFAFSPDGQRIVAARGNVLMGWDVATGRELFRDESLEAQPPVEFSPDGQSLILGGFNGSTGDRFLQLVDLRTMRRLQAIPMDTSPLGSLVAFSPDGKLLAFGVNSGKNGSDLPGGGIAFEQVLYVEIRSVPSLRLLRNTSSLEDGVLCYVAFTENGEQVVADNSLERFLFDVDTGRQLPEQQASPRGQFQYSHGTERVVVTGIDGSRDELAIWRPSDHRILVRWTWPEFSAELPLYFALDPAGRQLAVWSRKARQIQIFDVPEVE
jgi:hypothetical protein